MNGLTYNDGFINWNVNRDGRIVRAAPIIGMPPTIGFNGGKKQVEKMGRAIRNMSGNRNIQQRQIDQLCRKYNLSKEQRRQLHVYIHGEGLGYNEIERVIQELFRR